MTTPERESLFSFHDWGVRVGRVTIFWRDLWTQSNGVGIAISVRRWQYEAAIGFGDRWSWKRGPR